MSRSPRLGVEGLVAGDLEGILARVSGLGFEPALRGGVPVVLGMGFSSIALLFVRGDGHCAVLKLRRLGSKTSSLEVEARILERISRLGLAPLPLDYSHDHLLMEHVQGVSLGRAVDLTSRGAVERGYLEAAVSSALALLHRLDLCSVDHKEIGDPREHIILRNGDPLRPVAIDFESASIRESPSNVPRFVGGFLTRRLARVLNIPREGVEEMRRLARMYKRSGEKARIVEKILEMILQPR